MLPLLALFGTATSYVTNDFCTGATPVRAGLFQLDNNVGAFEYSQTRYIDGSDVFYAYNASVTGSATISASVVVGGGLEGCGIELVVHPGKTCAQLGNSYDSDYALGTDSTVGSCAAVNFAVFANEIYYFAIGTYGATKQGSWTFNITETPVARPPGDSCYAALTAVDGNNVAVSGNIGATSQINDFRDVQSEIFWKYNATCDGDVNVTLSGLPTATTEKSISVFWDNTCDSIYGVAGGDNTRDYDGDSGATVIESLVFPVVKNQWYYIATGDYFSNCGGQVLNLSVTCTPVARPANDQCSGATALTPSFSFSTAGATSQVNDNNAVGGCDNVQNEVWFSYTATCTGLLNVTLNDTTGVAIFAGSSCNSKVITTCNYDQYVNTADVQMNQKYFIAFGYSSSAQFITGTVTCTSVNNIPAGTSSSTPIAVTGIVSANYDNTNAVTDPATKVWCQSYSPNNVLFFAYTPNCTGHVDISAKSTTASSGLVAAFYQDATFANVQPPVYCYSNYLSSTAATFSVKNNQTVYFSVGNYYASDPLGVFQLNITCSPGASSAPTPFSSNAPTNPTSGSSNAPTNPTSAGSSNAPTSPTSTAPTIKGQTYQPTGASVAPTLKGQTYQPTAAPTSTSTTTSGAAMAGFGLATLFLALF